MAVIFLRPPKDSSKARASGNFARLCLSLGFCRSASQRLERKQSIDNKYIHGGEKGYSSSIREDRDTSHTALPAVVCGTQSLSAPSNPASQPASLNRRERERDREHIHHLEQVLTTQYIESIHLNLLNQRKPSSSSSVSVGRVIRAALRARERAASTATRMGGTGRMDGWKAADARTSRQLDGMHMGARTRCMALPSPSSSLVPLSFHLAAIHPAAAAAQPVASAPPMLAPRTGNSRPLKALSTLSLHQCSLHGSGRPLVRPR